MSRQENGSHMGKRRRNPVSNPTVTEIIRRPEAVAHDTFIDDLAVHTPPSAPPPGRGRER
jgi:hypothetical protein